MTVSVSLFAKVLTLMIEESSIMPDIFVQPKNWFIDFDSYLITPVDSSLYVTKSSPLEGNPIVESTSIVVEVELYWPIILVCGWILNDPYRAPSTLISLL